MKRVRRFLQGMGQVDSVVMGAVGAGIIALIYQFSRGQTDHRMLATAILAAMGFGAIYGLVGVRVLLGLIGGVAFENER